MVMGLMFAGHETTVGQAAWTVIQLLQHPAYGAALRQELDAHLIPGHPVDAQALRALNHVRCAVQETGRMYPSADLLIRLAEQAIDVGAYRIPKGWMVIVGTGAAHFLPLLFANPQQYDPYRFAPDRAEDRQHRFAIVGFGGGLHKCTGMNFATNEMSVIAALLFQQFDLTLLTPNPQIDRGNGTARPNPTLIRYRRRATTPVDPETLAAGVAAGCPHLQAVAESQAPSA